MCSPIAPDAVVVDGVEGEGADEVVDQALMRSEAGDQFESEGLAGRPAAGRGGGLREGLGGFPGHGIDPFALPAGVRRRCAGVRPLGCGFLGPGPGASGKP